MTRTIYRLISDHEAPDSLNPDGTYNTDFEAAAAQAFHEVCDMENSLATIEDLFGALNRIAIQIDSKASPALCRLCLIGLREVRQIEEQRGKLFDELHGFAYPNRESGGAV